MNNEKNGILLLGLMFVIMLFSCRKDARTNLVKLNKKDKIDQKAILFFKFPDTVPINKLVNGELRYNTSYNDLKKTDFDERYIFLHIMTNQKEEDVPLKKMVKMSGRLVYEDTIGDGWFSFQAVFTKSGKSTLHCIVEDIIVDDQVKKNKAGVTNETVITKDVYVQE